MNISSVTDNEIIRVRRAAIAARMKALRIDPFFASIGLQLEIVVCRTARGRAVPTAAVAGKYLYLNPDFFDSLTEAEQVGLIMHEILHKALGHDLRRDDRHPDVWNYACDYYINLTLVNTRKFTLPEGGLIDTKFIGYSEERAYKYMMDRASYVKVQPGEERSGQCKIDPDNIQIAEPQSQGGKSNGEDHDGHDKGGETGSSDEQDQSAGGEDQGAGVSVQGKDEGASGYGEGYHECEGGSEGSSGCAEGKDSSSGGRGSSEQGEGSGSSDSDVLPSATSGCGESGGSTEEEVAGPPKPKEGEGNVVEKIDALNVPWGEVWDAENDDGTKLTKEQRDQALNTLKQDLYASARMNRDAGSSGIADALRIIDHLVKPKADWKRELRGFISSRGRPRHRSFARLDRRGLAQDLYNPGEFGQDVGRIIALWDVSSSMDYVAHRALLAQLTEMRKTIHMQELTIAPFNSRVLNNFVFKLKPNDKLPEKFPVGGGTSFNSAFDWVNRQNYVPDGVIVFTDMGARCRIARPKYPVLWVSSCPVPQLRIPPFGKVVVIDADGE